MLIPSQFLTSESWLHMWLQEPELCRDKKELSFKLDLPVLQRTAEGVTTTSNYGMYGYVLPPCCIYRSPQRLALPSVHCQACPAKRAMPSVASGSVTMLQIESQPAPHSSRTGRKGDDGWGTRRNGAITTGCMRPTWPTQKIKQQHMQCRQGRYTAFACQASLARRLAGLPVGSLLCRRVCFMIDGG